MADVAKAMGFDGFDYHFIRRDFCRTCASDQLGNDGQRKLDLSDWMGQDYEALSQRQWGGDATFRRRRVSNTKRRARFVPTRYTLR